MRTAMPSISFVTLGCAKNEVDTQTMKRALASAGFSLVEEGEKADAVIVNTCSFIQAATEESLETIFDLAETPPVISGESKIIVAGCMPARYGEELEAELSESSAFVPCSKEDDIVSVVCQTLGIKLADLDGKETSQVEGCGSSEGDESLPVSAYVKISDGCDRFCSYCTIPFIRGRYHSFPREEIFADVERSVRGGSREIVLIAQDTGRWGTDFDQPGSLAALVGDLAETYPDTWFRLMYIQPEGVSDELLETIALHENICSYLDIPLQHCEERILKNMNRTGSFSAHLGHIQRIRRRIPDITLRTTLIAGFPGETEEEFEALCEFVEEAEFDYVGVFPYSREEGTKAAELPDQLDEEEKLHRAQQIRDIADALSTHRVACRIGSVQDVLVIGKEEDGQLFGRAKCQAPEVDGVVYLEHGIVGEVRRVVISNTLLYEMEGE